MVMGIAITCGDGRVKTVLRCSVLTFLERVRCPVSLLTCRKEFGKTMVLWKDRQ